MRRTMNGAATTKPPAQAPKPATNGVKAAPTSNANNDSEDLSYLTVKKSAISNPAELEALMDRPAYEQFLSTL